MTLNGRVSATAVYGAYVEVELGVEGLLRVGPDGLPKSAFSVGQTVEVVVLEVNEAARLIHFGLRQ